MSTSKRRLPLDTPIARAATLAVLLFAIAGVLFARSLHPDLVVFSNDGPLGAQMSERREMPGPIFGFWNPLNWAGYAGPAASPHFTNLSLWVLGPVGFAKFYVPLALVLLGLSAAFFLRQVGLSYAAACLGGIAAMLNSEFLSTACWGLPTWCMSFAFAYLAIGSLAKLNSRYRWARVLLAGAATGMCVMEGYDVGAIFSLVVAAFAVYQAGFIDSSGITTRVTKGVLITVLMAGTAGLVALHTVTTLVGTQVKDVVGMEQDAATKAQRWDEATRWSLPKKEILSVAVPGLFGYRMDSPDGGAYWGQVGRAPGWSGQPQTARFFGNGLYAGILVVVIALWAVIQSLRGRSSVFSETDRRWIWFWGCVTLISVLLSFGRFAPFYQLVYALPFFSTIRNPVKFLHVISWALVVLFAYGAHGLMAAYASGARATVTSSSWWRRLSSFDKKWVLGSGAAFVVALAAWLAYASSKQQLEGFLVEDAIPSLLAPTVAAFSIKAFGVFVVLLGVALTMVIVVLAGFFRGSRSAWTGVALGAFLVVDLCRASLPWIIYLDYKQKYASNPVIDFLRDSPHEHRVIGLPFNTPNELRILAELYGLEWKQHHFPYYNIQSMDVVQMARPPKDIFAFDSAFPFMPISEQAVARLPRRWELTNTRYLLGPAAFVDVLNTQLDAGQGRFSVASLFNITLKPGITEFTAHSQLTAVLTEDGPFAIIEFNGALPRAKLYPQWQVEPEETAVYELLTDPAFDPASRVIIREADVPAAESGLTNMAAGEVEILSYAPKRVVLEASNTVPAILLLNDKYDPNWKLTVDGAEADILRCNAVMRGTFLEPGEHTLEFRFEPSLKALYVTIAAMSVSVLLLGFVVVANLRAPASEPEAD